jgi:excisionase family DNA binding protein
MNNKEIMTISEVKDYLKISKSTVYDLVKSGKLEAIKIRSCYRVTSDSLKSFIDENKTF